MDGVRISRGHPGYRSSSACDPTAPVFGRHASFAPSRDFQSPPTNVSALTTPASRYGSPEPQPLQAPQPNGRHGPKAASGIDLQSINDPLSEPPIQIQAITALFLKWT